jgi:hypothetical protein
MRFKYKIPPFIFGVTIGLLVGGAFFIFKIDDYLKKFNKPNIDNIKIIEKVESNKAIESYENYVTEKKQSINTKNSPKVDYKRLDSLILDEEEVNVMKEEHLSDKKIKVINLDSKVQKDTLVNKLAGVTKDEYPDVFTVEFWKTPLNSKGYKMTRNRIVLYGLSDFSNITIYKVEDKIYLKDDDFVYKITSSPEFKTLELLDDIELLARIN